MKTHCKLHIIKKVSSGISILLILLLILAGCNTANKAREEQIPERDNSQQIEGIAMDTTPRVTGIGGVFFGTKNPDETRKWYGDNLGLAIDDYGSVFEFRNTNRPDEINYLRWSPFEEGSDYFNPSEKEFMINYRVQNLEGLVRKLKENGVTIVDEIVEYEYGKFVHILDSEGNKIELWEPVDSILTQMGGETTK